MLATPTRGLSRSVKMHNVDLDVMCDWIEGSVLFYESSFSYTDIADVLTERQIYDDQDFAKEMVSNAWNELRRRAQWSGDSYGLLIDTGWVKRQLTWQDRPAHAFCVLLSLAIKYDWWSGEFGHDYTEQGELFEELTKSSLESQFSGWQVLQTGWSRKNTVGIAQVVDTVTTCLCEEKGRLDIWNDPNVKELGLDLLWYRPFPDNRVGIAVYLVQCASGGNWRSKLKTPDLEMWRSIIQFTTMPRRAFAAPFSFLDKEFTQNCILVDGPFFDRCRLLGASHYREDWISQPLKDRIVAWASPRIDALVQRSL